MNSPTFVTALLMLSLLSLLLVAMIFLLLRNQSKQGTTDLLVNLLVNEQNRVQSLLNQVRASDPMTLHGLQAATQPDSTSNQQDEYVPTYDETYNYLQKVASNDDLVTQGVPDDLYASGWDEVPNVASGGNPVTFERPAE